MSTKYEIYTTDKNGFVGKSTGTNKADLLYYLRNDIECAIDTDGEILTASLHDYVHGANRFYKVVNGRLRTIEESEYNAINDSIRIELKELKVTHVQLFGITLVDINGNYYASIGNRYNLNVNDIVKVEFERTVKGVENGVEYQHIKIIGLTV